MFTQPIINSSFIFNSYPITHNRHCRFYSRSIISSRSLAILLGVSACGLTGYLILSILKKDEDDDDCFDVVTSTAKYKTVEIPIPKEVVGLLIGRNGKNIKQIRDRSNARVNLRDDDENTILCVIRGSQLACSVAESLVRECIANQQLLESVDIVVPQSCVGKIIGRSGERIQEIVAVSGAKVNVSDIGRNETTSRIVIKGMRMFTFTEISNIIKKYSD